MSDDNNSQRIKTIAIATAIVALLVGGGTAIFGSSDKKADATKAAGGKLANSDSTSSSATSSDAMQKLAAETKAGRQPQTSNSKTILSGSDVKPGATKLATATPPGSEHGDMISGGMGGGSSSNVAPFKNGDLVSLQCQDTVPGPKWLNGSVKSSSVGLSMQQEAAPASTWWKVIVSNEGSIVFESQDGGAGNFLSTSGTTGLRLQPNAKDPGAMWLVEKSERGWSLRNMDNPQGGRWVDCVAADNKVWMAPSRDGHVNGTSWKIVKKPAAGSDSAAQS